MDHQEYFIINSNNYQITIIDESIVQLKITKKKILKTIKLDENIFQLQLKFLKTGLFDLQVGFSMNIKTLHLNYEKTNIKINNISNLQISSTIDSILYINIPEIISFCEIYLRINKFDNFDIKQNKLFMINQPKINFFSQVKKIYIIHNKIISSIGEYFKIIFKNQGYECVTKNRLTISDCMDSLNDTIYIILFLKENHNFLPRRTIFYQIEQSNSKFLTDKKCLKKLKYIVKKAEQVWEYSSTSSDIYSKYCVNKLKWIPMPYVYLNFENSNLNDSDNCEYDIFFFGHKNDRRIKIIEELTKHFSNIKIGFECYNGEKINYIVKSKIILNIHYYNNTGLETCRINEILNYNKLIISEKSEFDENNMRLYSNLVVFVDEIDDQMKNINNLINKIKFYLSKSNYINFIHGNSTRLKSLEEKIQEKIIL